MLVVLLYSWSVAVSSVFRKYVTSPVGDLYTVTTIIAQDGVCIFIAQISMSISLKYLSILIFAKCKLSFINMHTPPHLWVFLQNLAPSVYWLSDMPSSSSSCRWCSVKQIICGGCSVSEFNNSSCLLERPQMFWWKIVKVFSVYLVGFGLTTFFH